MKMLHRIRCIRSHVLRTVVNTLLIIKQLIIENKQFQRCIFKLYILEQDRDQTFHNQLNLQIVVCLLHSLQALMIINNNDRLTYICINCKKCCLLASMSKSG